MGGANEPLAPSAGIQENQFTLFSLHLPTIGAIVTVGLILGCTVGFLAYFCRFCRHKDSRKNNRYPQYHYDDSHGATISRLVNVLCHPARNQTMSGNKPGEITTIEEPEQYTNRHNI